MAEYLSHTSKSERQSKYLVQGECRKIVDKATACDVGLPCSCHLGPVCSISHTASRLCTLEGSGRSSTSSDPCTYVGELKESSSSWI